MPKVSVPINRFEGGLNNRDAAREIGANFLAEAVNVDRYAVVTQAGDVNFEGAVGFDLFTPTYNASDTEVNFKTDGNKAFVTFGSGNIKDLNFL